MKFIKQLWDTQWKRWEKQGNFAVENLGAILLMVAILVVIVIIIVVVAKRGDTTQTDVLDAMRGVG